MSIPRYEQDMDGSMEPDSEGRWVRHDDHEILRRWLFDCLWKACADDGVLVKAGMDSQMPEAAPMWLHLYAQHEI